MQNNGITDVFFDLDHTLWDFDKNSGLAFERVFRKHKIELPLAEFLRVYEPINLDYWKKYREDRVSKEQLRRGRLTETFDCFKLKFPLETIDSLAHCYIEELPIDNHLFTGAVDILDYLSANYRLHIITNGFEEVQHLKLHNSGIKKYFSTVTTSEEVGLKKPHPVIFETALMKASVASTQSVMIGDSLEADIIGAQKAGMHTLFFNYRNEMVTAPHFAISELSEIKKHL
ncbi:haloacid dehalogenase [Aequorivita aquimaris]|jgi:putative hydrolase of the HAD superfamily|uniref:Haloacid dehalogenase n=1 Tax=Aequorivita aquimaris TaxID=1548749 RepID=A0A137RG99_9FLAO|nr:YjjG family noncanonical pyrimidine nucleotidase [Aequorivita aquimaris]KXN98517.1 haloacid dehalogenase [Aequorivita aquimaris]MDX1783904.1 YjjG family noncanonical pyrimidine nucleotidase [Aequorivita vladivostokensis]HBL80393.1 noncanonical pyrimidine nucleotidase, YjjG family [Aequorivita sp.]|tara:strand:- start:243 stop:932 length:690 start_codon:yes stop_codon:yes gene_type:complete